MPFTLSHPAAVLPLLRRPFIPGALAAGAMAPDIPYFLGTLGISATASHTWYEPFLNATVSHSPAGALTVDLPFTLALLAFYRLLRAPMTALLPAGWRLPAPAQTHGLRERRRHLAWLLLSALIGTATHLAWDSFTHRDGFLVSDLALLRSPALGGLTVSGLLGYVSSIAGLAVVGRYLWRHRDRLRTQHDTRAHLSPIWRWSIVAALALACALGAVVHTQGNIDAYRHTTQTDYGHPITRDLDGGGSLTTYPTRTVDAPWGTTIEELLHDAARGAGAWLAVALLAYCVAWQIRRFPAVKRGKDGAGSDCPRQHQRSDRCRHW